VQTNTDPLDPGEIKWLPR